MKILLAADGTESSSGAVRIAALLAERDSALVEVATVAEAPPEYRTGYPVVFPSREHEQDRVHEHLTRVEAQLTAAGVPSGAWPIRLGIEAPARFIDGEIRKSEAALVVLGLGRRRTRDRLFADEMAIQVARLSSVPVLAVEGGASRLPQNAIAGIDFSPFSLEAARAACRLVGPDGVVRLVHVAATAGARPDASTVAEVLRQAAEPSPECPDADMVVLEGDPARELVSFASDHDHDLIAVGSHGRSFIDRLLLGSVSTTILRAASCSVLVVPPA